MGFKAKIGTHLPIDQIKGKFKSWVSPVEYEFTKNKIHSERTKIPVFNPDSSNSTIDNGAEYTLTKLEKDSIFYSRTSKFEATFKNGVSVLLITNRINTFCIKWTHKLTWWQRENSWIVKTAIVTILGIITSYFISYRVGYQDGRRKGLEEAKSKDSLSVSMGHKQLKADTIGKPDTTYSLVDNDTTKHK